MDENVRVNKFSWVEGLVDKNSEHIKITYKENSDPFALIGKGDGKKFIVQFLNNKDQPNNEEILRYVIHDIDYYLIDLEERDPWRYAQYHCTTSSNIYSDVHWGYCK
jgi:hypothetical protein